MRVLICPDKFAGTLSAIAAAEAIATGWARVARDDELVLRPLCDGGPGFVAVLAAALSGRRVPVSTVDPLGRPVAAEILLTGSTAYVESAQSCGLHLLSAAERDPKATTSFGLGVLLVAAVEYGARRVVVGLGGSATNDAGAGALAAVGVTPLDAAGCALPHGGASLVTCTSLDGAPRLHGATLTAATDVDNPLTGRYGATAVYGPQKGASPTDVPLLDAALEHFAGVLERDLVTCPPGLAGLPGSGAAGGLGAAIMALGGRRVPGFALVRELTGVDTGFAEADLVITGEGSFDAQSLRGKVVAGVAGAARERGLPCVVLAGRVDLDAETAAAAAGAGVTEAHSLVSHFGDESLALRRSADGLAELAGRLARSWRR